MASLLESVQCTQIIHQLNIPKVFAMEVWVLASEFQSFVPDKAVDTEVRCEVEFDKMPFTLGVDQGISVDTEALHHSIGARN